MNHPCRLRTRAGRVEDYGFYARLFQDLDAVDPVADENRFVAEVVPSLMILEEEPAGPRGYAYFRVFKDLGRVIDVVIDERFRAKGFGRFLMVQVAARLRELGCARWTLHVRPDNAPAIRLYRSVGLQVDHELSALRVTWIAAQRLAPSGRGIVARTIADDGSEDLRIERSLDLGHGSLGQVRGSGSRVALRLEDPAEPDNLGVGATVFDPEYPCAWPFRVRTPDLLREMFDAMRPYAGGREHVDVFVEGDAALCERLIDIGARVLLRRLQMSGSLPNVL